MAYREPVKTPSMLAVDAEARQTGEVNLAVQDLIRSQTSAGIITDDYLKLESVLDTIEYGLEAKEYKDNEAEDDTKIEEVAQNLADIGYDIELKTLRAADILKDDTLNFSDKGLQLYVDGELWTRGKALGYHGIFQTNDAKNVFERMPNSYLSSKDLIGRYDYSAYDTGTLFQMIVGEEHKGFGFANLKDITEKEYQQLFEKGFISRQEPNPSKPGEYYDKQYRYNKKSLAKNTTKDPYFDGTWDHGLGMINSAWVNSKSGITLDLSHEDYKNDAASLEFGRDGVTKDVLHQGIAKIGEKHYGKDKWQNASNITRQKWLQDNTKMNVEIAKYLLTEGGTGGISDRGGANQWSTFPALARKHNLGILRGNFKQDEGAFFGKNRGFDMGDFFGKNSIWRTMMNKWKKGK